MSKQKVIIQRILNLDGTWQGYKLSPSHAYAKYNWPEPGKQFNSLSEIITFYNLEDVKESGTKYSYDNKNQKYGIEEHSAIIKLKQ